MTVRPTIDNPEPAGAIWSEISASDGVRLRTVRWIPAGASKGTVVLLGGRGEFVEKYFEVIHELLARGFAVAAMDWRGQGGSARALPNASKGHVDDFHHYERDLEALIQRVLEPECPRPWYGLCHSMGAAILLGICGAGRCPFDRVVLTSPMIAVKRINHRGPKALAVRALAGLGFGRVFVPGGNSPSLWLSSFKGNVFTSDPTRFARIAALVAKRPELTLGGPTLGWTSAAFRHMRRLGNRGFSRAIVTPVLIVASGADQVTDTAATERFAVGLASGRTIVVEGAEHEIMIERDVLREQFWAAFDQFVPGSPTN